VLPGQRCLSWAVRAYPCALARCRCLPLRHARSSDPVRRADAPVAGSREWALRHRLALGRHGAGVGPALTTVAGRSGHWYPCGGTRVRRTRSRGRLARARPGVRA